MSSLLLLLNENHLSKPLYAFYESHSANYSYCSHETCHHQFRTRTMVKHTQIHIPVEIHYRTVFGIEYYLILYFSLDPTLLCACVKTESQNIKLYHHINFSSIRHKENLKHSFNHSCDSLFLHHI
jgi:hypothetical protein